MANLKLRIEGITIKEASVNSDWEEHLLNSTLHPYLSDTIDGVSIIKIRITSMTDAISIGNNGNPVSIGDEIIMSDMNNDLVLINFNHTFSSGELRYEAIGSTTFQVILTINSIV